MVSNWIYISSEHDCVVYGHQKILNLINHRIVGKLVPQWHLWTEVSSTIYSIILWGFLRIREGAGKRREFTFIYYSHQFMFSSIHIISQNFFKYCLSPILSFLFILGPSHSILIYSQNSFHICYLLTFWIISQELFSSTWIFSSTMSNLLFNMFINVLVVHIYHF